MTFDRPGSEIKGQALITKHPAMLCSFGYCASSSLSLVLWRVSFNRTFPPLFCFDASAKRQLSV